MGVSVFDCWGVYLVGAEEKVDNSLNRVLGHPASYLGSMFQLSVEFDPSSLYRRRVRRVSLSSTRRYSVLLVFLVQSFPNCTQ